MPALLVSSMIDSTDGKLLQCVYSVILAPFPAPYRANDNDITCMI